MHSYCVCVCVCCVNSQSIPLGRLLHCVVSLAWKKQVYYRGQSCEKTPMFVLLFFPPQLKSFALRRSSVSSWLPTGVRWGSCHNLGWPVDENNLRVKIKLLLDHLTSMVGAVVLHKGYGHVSNLILYL